MGYIQDLSRLQKNNLLSFEVQDMLYKQFIDHVSIQCIDLANIHQACNN